MDRRVRRRFGQVLRHGRWIIAGTLLSMCTAFIVSHALPKIYAATTYILVSGPSGSSTIGTAWDLTLIPTYLPLVDNDAILANALQQFHLDQAPFRLTVHRFRKKGYLDVRLPKSSRLIEIDVRFPDAQLAAGMANYVAESAIEMNDQANELETAAIQKTLKDHLDRQAAHLSETEAGRIALQQRAQIQSREAQLEMLLDERAQISKQIESLQFALPQGSSDHKSLQQSSSAKPGTAGLRDKVPDPFPGYDTAPRGAGQAWNATSDELQRKSAYSAVRMPGEPFRAAKSRLPRLDRRIDNLASEIAQFRGDIERSDQDFQLASEAYEKASREYNDAPMTVTERSVTLRQVSPALISEQPVGPGALVNSLLAGVLAIVLFCAALVALEILREIRSESYGRIVEEESESAGARSV